MEFGDGAGVLRFGVQSDADLLYQLAIAGDLSEYGNPHWKPANLRDFDWPPFKVGISSRIDFVIDSMEWGVIGTCCLHRIDWRNRVSSIGITIYDEQYRNRGIGTMVVKALQDWAYGTLGLRRLEAYILDSNAASLSLFLRRGFVREGVLRQRFYIDRSYRDVMLLGWLQNE